MDYLIVQLMDQIKNGFEEPNDPEKLQLGHIFSPMILLVIGLVLATISFLIEVGSSYKEKKKHQRRPRKRPKLA